MLQRSLLFSLLLPCTLAAGIVDGGFNRLAPPGTNKSTLTFEGNKVVDAEIVQIGPKLTMRLTYDDGVQQLLVKNLAGQFVPVHKARRQVMRALTTLATYAGLCALAGTGGAFLLYHYGTDTEDGKRVVPTVSALLQYLIEKLSGNSDGELL